MRRALLAFPLLAAALPAAAGEGCTCRANGQNYTEGSILCIRGQLSRCEMNFNVTSWNVIADTCPEAGMDRPKLAKSPPKNSINNEG